jgi:hypothetical protein
MGDAYRSVDAIVDDRLTRFRARRAGEQETGELVARVFAARHGRIAGGVAGAVCGSLVFLASVVAPAAPYVIDLPHEPSGAAPTYLLAGSGIAALLVAAIARRAALGRAVAALQREPALTGDGPEDLARIDRADPLGDLRACATTLETKSVALPLAALALLAPLTIHGVVAVGISVANGGCLGPGDFTTWIGMSAVFVGLAHLTLLLRVMLWARSLRRRETGSLGKGVHAQWGLTLLITTAAAFVPGAFMASEAEPFSLIPPGLVLVTGAAFLPLAYVATVRQLERERAILAPT